MDLGEFLSKVTDFEWDEANVEKNWEKHKVLASECEQVFFNQPLLVSEDAKHLKRESRYWLLGKTDAGRKLFVVFTLRGNSIRVVSARDMNRKERAVYETA